ncbi:MAG: preprotein translocase subunit SecG [Rikenellaceae bacterium]|nr:preprotein translocase subunit SecG [Rikenellaceae bacterium]
MYTFFIILIVIASILLILAVLAQHPKSGMAANFGASNQVMGVRQTTDFLERFTWGTSIAIVLFTLMATMSVPKENIAGKSVVEENIQNTFAPLNQSLQVPLTGIDMANDSIK